MSEIDQKPRSRLDMNSVSPTQAGVRRLRSLAPLPRTSQLLLQTLSDPELDMLQLAGIVEQTPALAARILGVANSAFFANTTAVRDVPDAIIRVLGLNLVRDLSTSFVLSQPFDFTKCPRFDAMRYWTAAMESAVLAQMIVNRLPLTESPSPAEAYLCGLLHNLGLLALIHVAPEAMHSVFTNAEREPTEDLAAHEQQVMGIDHAAAGAELAVVWHLPPLLALAMGPANARPQPRGHRLLLSILQLCAQIRHCVSVETDPAEEPDVLAEAFELGLTSAATSQVITQWQERSEEIVDLAATFVGAK